MLRKIIMVSLVATIAAWSPIAHALPAVATTPAQATSGCDAAAPANWCAAQSNVGALDGRLPDKPDAFGTKPGTFTSLMQNLGLEANEVVYAQTDRASPLRRSEPTQAKAKRAAILPEPATWVMLLLGFGAIGAFVRRRFRKSEERFNARIRSIEAGEAS